MHTAAYSLKGIPGIVSMYKRSSDFVVHLKLNKNMIMNASNKQFYGYLVYVLIKI